MTRSKLLALAAGIAALLATLGPARAAGEITIVRDSFGVPHVYGATGDDVAYGAGYALAQDRLWQMHIFRLVAKGRLSHLLGPVIVESDKEVRFWTYTASERAARFQTYPADIRSYWLAWVDGINAWITEARQDPMKLPFEFVEFAEPLEDWTIDDSIAMSDYLIWTFGSGGGSEVNNLASLQAYIGKFGAADGRRVFDDLVWVNDPDAPPSIPAGYDWHAEDHGADLDDPRILARALEPDARISLPLDQRVAGPATTSLAALRGPLARIMATPVTRGVLGQIRAHEEARAQLEQIFWHFGSNAQIVAPHRTTTGNAGLQAGPQVGLFVPQALSDFGLHAADGSMDATGMTFAGVGPAVLIGRGNGFNWTTTTGASDLTDTFIETLNPADRTQYLFDPDGDPDTDDAVWERMECRTEEYTIKGIPFDSQEICRTRHGPVLAFDEANGVAYAARMGWFNKEAGTVEGFFRYQEATSLEEFATFAALLASNHNMFYADDQGNIGYWHPGYFPGRPAGDLRLPFVGTGEQEWLGLIPVQDAPHTVNLPRGWLANWNNKPAADWDRESGWGAVHGVATFFDNLDANGPAMRDPFGGSINPDRQVSWQDLNANIRYAAYRDFNADFFQAFVPASSPDPVEQLAIDTLAEYDGFIYDANGNGYVDSGGYAILGRFVSDLRNAVFNDDLAGVPNRSSTSALSHIMNPDTEFEIGFGWLNGNTRAATASAAFTTSINALKQEFGNQSPRTWLRPQPTQHYTRLNADLLTDVARTTARSQIRGMTGVDVPALRPGAVNVPPGNIPDQMRMNRGTYNHLVLYTDPPSGSGVLGESAAEHGSVIAPGQNGFINILLQEGPHSRDQFDLYQTWRYKPMPMTLAEARAVAESEITLTRS